MHRKYHIAYCFVVKDKDGINFGSSEITIEGAPDKPSSKVTALIVSEIEENLSSMGIKTRSKPGIISITEMSID